MNKLTTVFTIQKSLQYLSRGNSVISPEPRYPFFTLSVKPPSIYTTIGAVRTYCNMASSNSSHKQTITAVTDDRISRISSSIRVIPDFPKPGIIFQDITTMLLDPVAFKYTIDLFVERYLHKNISVVAGVEARGFIFGPPIALAIGAKFVPMRKPNKLPGAVISEEYSLEYGTDTMEMHVGAVEAGERTLVIDDLIATGGTLGAAIKLLERVGANIVECACVIELPDLKLQLPNDTWVDSQSLQFQSIKIKGRGGNFDPFTLESGRDRLGDKQLFVLVSST